MYTGSSMGFKRDRINDNDIDINTQLSQIPVQIKSSSVQAQKVSKL